MRSIIVMLLMRHPSSVSAISQVGVSPACAGQAVAVPHKTFADHC